MDSNWLKELENKIDSQVNKILDGVQNLEWLVNCQIDTSQRHADQAYIHTIMAALTSLETDRKKNNYTKLSK